MPSKPRLVLFFLVALAIALGFLLLVAPHDTANRVTRFVAPPVGIKISNDVPRNEPVSR